MGFLIFVGLMVTGYLTGRYFEKKHYSELIRREEGLRHIPMISGEWKNTIESGEEGQLFSSGVVVASDYFKTTVSGFKSLIGGRLTAYESLLERGRREAVMRMKEEAVAWGAHKIVNVRVETSIISSAASGGGLPCVELFAYGTALRYQKNSTSA